MSGKCVPPDTSNRFTPGAVEAQIDRHTATGDCYYDCPPRRRRRPIGASLSVLGFSRGDVTPTVRSPAFTGTRICTDRVSPACRVSIPRNRILKRYSASTGK